MLKQTLTLCLLFIVILLTGCTAEKLLTIEGSRADDLYMSAISAIKKEVNTSNLNFDLSRKSVAYSNYSGNNFPSSVELTFSQNGTNTLVKLKAENANEDNLLNLQKIINDSYSIYKKSLEANDDNPAPQLRRIDMAK